VMANVLLWDQHASGVGLATLLACLLGAAFYQQAPPRSLDSPTPARRCPDSDPDSDTNAKAAAAEAKAADQSTANRGARGSRMCALGVAMLLGPCLLLAFVLLGGTSRFNGASSHVGVQRRAPSALGEVRATNGSHIGAPLGATVGPVLPESRLEAAPSVRRANRGIPAANALQPSTSDMLASGGVAAFIAALENLQATGSCSVSEAHNLHYWGMYSLLNQASRALIKSFAAGTRACFRAPIGPPWAYEPGTPEDTASRTRVGKAAERGCKRADGYECYFTHLASCDLQRPQCSREGLSEVPLASNVTGEFTRAGTFLARPTWAQVGEVEYDVTTELVDLQRRFGISDPAHIRGAVVRWLMQATPYAERHFQRRLRSLRAGARHVGGRFVAMHVRLGDKAREAQATPMIKYAMAAEAMADESAMPIFVFTTAAAVVRDALDALAPQLANRTRFIIPAHLVKTNLSDTWMVDWAAESAANGIGVGEQNGLDALSDMRCMASGIGAVATYSSNMGRFLHYLTEPRVRTGEFEIVSVDADTMPPPGQVG
jgi:hypothetical protein